MPQKHLFIKTEFFDKTRKHVVLRVNINDITAV